MSRPAILFLALILAVVLEARAEEKPLEDFLDEMYSVARRAPTCLADENGLPRRVLITRNGTSLFETPAEGAKALRPLGLYDRLFLYVDDTGTDFYRVGTDPFGTGQEGFVPKAFCLHWDHNEMLFLNKDSAPTDVLHVWATLEDAQAGDPMRAIAAERVDAGHEQGKFNDVIFPVLEKDPTANFYKIGYVLGGQQGDANAYGRKLTKQEKQQVQAKLTVVNLQLVIDATSSMVPHIEEAKSKATEIVRQLEADGLVKKLATQEPIDLTVNFGLIAYRDRGDAFEVRTFLPLTNDLGEIERQLSELAADEGGDTPEMVLEGVAAAIPPGGFPAGALNRVILIGDAPAHANDSQSLRSAGVAVKSAFAQLDALVCGDNPETRAMFEDIAAASGGQARQLADAAELADGIVNDIKERLGLVPVEVTISDLVEGGKTFREAAEELGIQGRMARTVQQFLEARGANLGDSGKPREGWVKVRPGPDARLKLYVYLPRWELAERIGKLIGLGDNLDKRKDLAATVKTTLQTFFELEAGRDASAGIATSGESPAERGEAVPDLTKAVRRGESGVERFNKANQAKVLALLDIWNNPQLTEHDYIFVPLELLP